MSAVQHDFDGLRWAMSISLFHQAILWEFYYREACNDSRRFTGTRWQFWLDAARMTFDSCGDTT